MYERELLKNELSTYLVNNSYQGYFQKQGRRYAYRLELSDIENENYWYSLGKNAIDEIRDRAYSTKYHLYSAIKFQVDKCFYGTVTIAKKVEE